MGERACAVRANSCDKAMNNGHMISFKQDYSVLDLLGKGGFACVYRAKCKSNGLEVAIKMVSVTFFDSQ